MDQALLTALALAAAILAAGIVNGQIIFRRESRRAWREITDPGRERVDW